MPEPRCPIYAYLPALLVLLATWALMPRLAYAEPQVVPTGETELDDSPPVDSQPVMPDDDDTPVEPAIDPEIEAMLASDAVVDEPAPWWRVGVDVDLFFDNTEYVGIPFRDGETFLGGRAAPTFTFLPGPGFEITLGVFGNYFFGDDNFLEPILPIVRFHFDVGSPEFAFNFGVIDSDHVHGFYDALIMRQVVYSRPIQYGVQVLSEFPWLDAEVWTEWQMLNTPAHRELFEMGVRAQFFIDVVELALRGMYTHHGGQLFAVSPVADSFAVQVTAALNLELPPDAGERLRFAFSALGSRDEPDRDDAIAPEYGGGFLGEIAFTFKPFEFAEVEIAIWIWVGENYISEAGSGVFRTEVPLPFLTMKTDMVALDNLHIRSGGELWYFSNFDVFAYTYTLSVEYVFTHEGN